MINCSKSYLGIFLAQISYQKDPHYVSKIVDSEVRQISAQIFSLWTKLVKVISSDLRTLNISLKDKYLKKMKERVSLYVLTDNNSGSTKILSEEVAGS